MPRWFAPALLTLALVLLVPARLQDSGRGRAAAAIPSGRAPAEARARYAALPLSFEANQGQTDRTVAFVSRGPGYTLFLARSEAVLRLAPPAARRDASAASAAEAVVRLGFAGARAGVRPSAVNRLPGASHYLMGRDRSRWRRDVARFEKVRYRDLYPGVDLLFYGRGRELEYDLVVSPGADPAGVRLRIEGARSAEVDGAGDLRLGAGTGHLLLRRPAVYQEGTGGRTPVAAAYRLREAPGRFEVGFDLGRYDPGRALVIDPVLSYASAFGGSGDEAAAGLAVDAAGNAYITGSTTSVNFPATAGAVNTTGGTAFITELNAAGTATVYSTYFGGTGTDTPYAIGLDATGAAYVVGTTSSSDFPTTSDAFRTAKKAGSDAFVLKLLPLGSTLGYSTFLGGAGADVARAVAVDPTGNAYVCGTTTSADFPTSVGAFRTLLAGGTDGFVVKLNPFGTSLVYGGYLGGSGSDTAAGIAIDRSGNAYVTGDTASSDFPVTSGALQTSRRGPTDAFVARVDAGGGRLGFATYLGGDGDDSGKGVAVDASGSAYVAGWTTSANFPTTAGAFLRTLTGTSASFAARLTASGGAFVYSTLVTSGIDDAASAIAVDDFGSAWVAGRTSSSALPVSADAFQKRFASAAVYRTMDAALSWDPASAGIGGFAVLALAIDPSDGNTLYAGTDAGGVYRTTDGGQIWTRASSGLTDAMVTSIGVDPRTPATLYAGTFSRGVFKSVNRGVTWTPSSAGIPQNQGVYAPVNALAIDPVTPAIVYAGTGDGVFKTTNGGSAWSASNANLLDTDIRALVIDTAQVTTLYCSAGVVGIFKSFNSGGSWNAINSNLPRSPIPALALDPKFPANVYAALAGLGIYRSTNGGAQWVARNIGLLSPNVTALGMDPSFTSRIYVGTTDQGLYKTFNGANEWGPVNSGLINPYVYAIAVDPVNPSRVFVATRGGDDAFVVKLGPTGADLPYATYIGGTGHDSAAGLALDRTGNLYVAGGTVSPDFGVTAGAYKTAIRGSEAWIARIAVDPPPMRHTLFPQVTAGKGYTTTFILTNAGAATSTGTLVLKDQSGDPLLVTATQSPAGPAIGSPAPSVGRGLAPASSFPISLPAGGVQVLTVDRPGATDTRSGWAGVDWVGGSLGGVSTFQFTDGGVLRTIAGVLGSEAVPYATLPVDNDDAASRYTGFAVANPGTDNVEIRLITLSESGAVVDRITPVDLNPLPPQRQAAKFLHEYLPARLKFKGSLVLVASGGKTFGVVGLLLNQGLLTALPVIPEKASVVPN